MATTNCHEKNFKICAPADYSVPPSQAILAKKQQTPAELPP